MNAGFLTHAYEALGMDPSDEATKVLLDGLKSRSALVREGAIYGLTSRVGVPGVRAVLEKIAKNDPSTEVRAAAQGALDD